MDNILGTGFITITDLSDPIISSTEPPSVVEDMLWLDISTTPPVLKVYKNGQWIAVSETGSLPDSVPVGGYFGGDFLVNQSITGVKKAGEIKINAGAYIHPDGTTYVIPNNKAIYTGCKGKEGDIRYILFIGSDASRFTFSSDSASRHFVETVYKNKSWYYFVNDKTEREFEISQKDCIVAKIEEYTSLDASNGIKNIIKYYEDKETIFEALTDGGKNQAIYKKNGLLYINAGFIKAGKIASLNGLSEFDLENGALKVGAKTGNHLIFDGNELSIKASKINIGASTVATNTDVGNAVNAGINNLQIGGRNLATETNRGVTGWDWALATGGKTITEVSEDGIRCCKFVRDSVSSTGWNYIRYNKINRNKYLPNKQYTVSFEVKASVVTSFYVTLMEGNSTNALCTAVKTSNTIANTWTKLSVTLTTVSTLPTSTSQVLYMQGMNSGVGVSYIFRNLVISEGNKPTAWTPAPEDIDSNIQGVKDNLKNNYSTTTQMKSAIEQSASGILSTVSSTYTTKNDFNNLQIGGRNLIKNSNFITQATSSSNASIYSVSLVDGISLNEMFLHKTVTFSYFVNCTGNRQNGSGDLGNRFGIHGTVTWKNSSTGKTTINYPFAECLTGTYENKRVVMHYTFTPPSGYDVIASFNFAFQPLAKPGANNTVVWKIGQPKLEIGNKATDYSPAPEDIDSNMQGIKDNLKNNYSTTLQMNSAIEQKASGILSTVSSTYTTKNDFNNLQIGGRNLLIKNSLESGNLSGANGSVLEGTYANFYRTKNFIDVDNSSKYILTINKYTSSDVIEKIVAYNSSGAYISTHSINAKQAIFTPPANCTKIKFVVIIANANTLTIVESFKIKLEKGTKATDWTPAPEDIDSNMQGIKDDLKNNYSTTLQMNSAIEQKASGILSTVSSTYTTKTDFNNLQIGGRNYCRDTITSWTITGNNTPNQTGYKYSISKPSDLAGQKINVSFKYTVSNYGGGCFRLQTNAPSYLGGSNSITPSGNGVFTSNFTATYGSSFSSTTMGIRLDNFIGTIVISELKLEIGNKSTSWTPAPEDVDSNIQGVKDDLKNNYSTTTQMKSAVEQSASGVLSTVSKSYYTKSETDKQITSKGYQTASQVQQTVHGLEVKISESGGYNILRNSTFQNNDIDQWWYWGYAHTYGNKSYFKETGDMWFGVGADNAGGLWQNGHELEPNTEYTLSLRIGWESNVKGAKFVIEYTPDAENNGDQITSQHFGFKNDSTIRQSVTFTTPSNIRYAKMGFWHGGSTGGTNAYLIYINKPCLTKGLGTVWSPNPDEVYSGITTIDKDGIKISMQDGEGAQGYTRIAHDGMEIFNANGSRTAHFGDNNTAYIQTLTADKINNRHLLRWNEHRPRDLYVAPIATGDGTGRDANNKANCISNTLNWLWNTYGCYSWQSDIIIHLAPGDYWGADNYIGGWIGSGVIYVILEPWACLRSPIRIEECAMTVVIKGSIDPYNIEVQDNAYLYLNYDGYGIYVRNSTVVVAGLNMQCEGWYGDMNTWGDYRGYGVYATDGSNVLVTNCDIVGFWYGCGSRVSSYVSMLNCVGHVGCGGVAVDGGILSIDRAMPLCSSLLWRNVGGHLLDPGGTWTSNSKFAPKPSAPQVPPPAPVEKWAWVENTFWAGSLWTTPEGSGSGTSARSGQWGQGKWGSYKPHRGFASFSGVNAWCNGGRNFTVELTMTRLNTSHGVAGATPVPKIKTTNGSFWNCGKAFARGATHTVTLPSDVATALATGGWDRLEMWAGTSTNDYSFYDNVRIRVVCEKCVQ